MWSWEEASRLYILHHLDWKSNLCLLIGTFSPFSFIRRLFALLIFLWLFFSVAFFSWSLSFWFAGFLQHFVRVPFSFVWVYLKVFGLWVYMYVYMYMYTHTHTHTHPHLVYLQQSTVSWQAFKFTRLLKAVHLYSPSTLCSSYHVLCLFLCIPYCSYSEFCYFCLLTFIRVLKWLIHCVHYIFALMVSSFLSWIFSFMVMTFLAL